MTRDHTFTRFAKTAKAVLMVLSSCLLAALGEPATADENITPTENKAAFQADADNAYLAGFGLRPAGPVVGDLFAAGCPLSVDQPVGKDAVVAGCDIHVRGPVGEDLRAAGGQVTIDGKVGGEAVVAGGKVTLTSGADIAGRAWLTGGKVNVAGKVGKDLKIYAGKVTIAGEVEGNTRVVAQEIEMLAGAKIKGTLTYTSRDEIKLDPKAQVLGKVTREPTPKGWRGEERWERRTRGFWPLWLVGLIGAGTVFILLFPSFTKAAQANVGLAPWKSLALGTAVLFAGPPLAVILLITVIGIPIALALLAAYAILLLIGYLTTANFIGERVAELVRKGAEITIGWRIGTLVVALVLLALVRMIPFVGGLIMLVALLFGLGALVLQLFRRYSGAT
jgi:cytoskeletal protein CcmA (bactofilin family)